eukprot:1583044-Rhodomonas_salina.3
MVELPESYEQVRPLCEIKYKKPHSCCQSPTSRSSPTPKSIANACVLGTNCTAKQYITDRRQPRSDHTLVVCALCHGGTEARGRGYEWGRMQARIEVILSIRSWQVRLATHIVLVVHSPTDTVTVGLNT